MLEKITVHVAQYGRKNWYMRYRDPVTGKDVVKSSRCRKESEARKVAAKWEAELQEGRYKPPSKTTWAEFRQRYEDEVVPGLSVNTAGKIDAAFNAVEEYINPARLMSFNADAISRLIQKLRDKRRLAESSIKSHLAHLQAALNWAVTVGLIRECPSFTMPQRAKSSKLMKGRPITGEEFDRLLAKVPDVVTKEFAPKWKRSLRGLWLSGLRLGEALDLWWDRDDRMHVDLSGKYPALRILAETEKGHQDRLLPLAPEFCEWLLETPEDERTGRVFKFPAQRTRGEALTLIRVSQIITAIGEKAGVKVSTSARTGNVKYASAHDLRRSFGERWAQRVMPQVLRELMRHESIETTMKFYVGRNATTTAETLRAAMCNTLCNTPPISATADLT